MVVKKVAAILRHGMTPIVCVGETLGRARSRRHRDQGARPGPRRVAAASTPRRSAPSSSPTSRSGRSAPVAPRPRQDAQQVCGAIRGCVSDARRCRRRCSRSHPVRRQREGANIAELMAQPDIDGALVGGASLDPDEFARIVQARRIVADRSFRTGIFRPKFGQIGMRWLPGGKQRWYVGRRSL